MKVDPDFGIYLDNGKLAATNHNASVVCTLCK